MIPSTLQGRLALTFGAATLAVATVLGLIVFATFHIALRNALDDDLTTRFDNLSAFLAQTDAAAVDPTVAPVLPETESFAQVVRVDGKVLTASPRALLAAPVLSPAEVRRARVQTETHVHAVPPDGNSARLRAGLARLGDEPVVIVVGTGLEQSAQAERRLALALGLGLPLLSILVGVGGWFLAGAVLAPVRSMVDDAGELAAREPGQRLSIPIGGEELAELARRLNGLLDRIESAMVHERAFLDDASHELRTPIAIVRGEVELARMAAADNVETRDSEVARALDSTLEEVERLDRLAANLLVLARTRAGQTGEARRVDLVAVARRATNNAERARRVVAVANDVDVVIQVDGTSESSQVVLGDETALERAIGNVVDNALRHAGSRVEVDVRRIDDELVVEVRDDGPGFPEAILPTVFDRFTSDEAARGAATPSVGLGLAIVDAIATAHGGRAVAANGPDGAIVRLELPGEGAEPADARKRRRNG
jgi:two-component system, OmpR family, sensor kinase